MPCSSCQLDKFCENPHLTGTGELFDPLLIIISEAPTPIEDLNGTPYVDEHTEILKEILGDKYKNCYLTYLCKCPPYKDFLDQKSGTRSVTGREAALCFRYLEKELLSFPDTTPVLVLGRNTSQLILKDQYLEDNTITENFKIRNKTFKVFNTVDVLSTKYNPKARRSLKKMIGLATGDTHTSKNWEILTPEDGCELIYSIAKQYRKGEIEYVAYDIETSSFDFWGGEIIGSSWCTNSSEIGYYIPYYVTNHIHHEDYQHYVEPIPWEVSPQQLAKLKAVSKKALATVPIVGHNVKFDIKFSIAQGFCTEKFKVYNDTMFLAFLFQGRPFGESLDLKSLAVKYFDIFDSWDKPVSDYIGKFKRIKDRSYKNLPTYIVGKYGGQDTFYTKELNNLFMKELPTDMTFIREILNRATEEFSIGELKGVKVDYSTYGFLKETYTKFLSGYTTDLLTLPVPKRMIEHNMIEVRKENSKRRSPLPDNDPVLKLRSFNLNSSRNIATLLYDKNYYSLPVLQKTEKKLPSTNKIALSKLLSHKDTPEEAKTFIKGMQNYNAFSKLKSTYIDSMESNTYEGNYQANFNLVGAKTGRLCLLGNTKIETDSGPVKIENLEKGKKFFVYSYFKQKVRRFPAISLGETKRITSFAKVRLTNGALVGCTVDHPWMTLSGTFKDASKLVAGDELMPFGLKKSDKWDWDLASDILYQPINNSWVNEKYTDSLKATKIQTSNYSNDGSILDDFPELVKSCLENLSLSVKVLSVNIIECEEIPVYDISVPNVENFAISAGCFVHNSSGFHTLPSRCLRKGTKISLLDGTEINVEDLVGKEEFWVYSSTLDGDIVPGRGHSARITKEVTKLHRITLDNNEVIECTDNHPFLSREGTYIKAEDLTVGQSLMPLYREMTNASGARDLQDPGRNKYFSFRNNKGSRRLVPVHRMVGEHFAEERPETVHHKDDNPRNNDPSNLEGMTKSEHQTHHFEEKWKDVENNQYLLVIRQWDDAKREKRAADSSKMWKNASPQKKKNMAWGGEARENASKSRSENFKKNPKACQSFVSQVRVTRAVNCLSEFLNSSTEELSKESYSKFRQRNSSRYLVWNTLLSTTSSKTPQDLLEFHKHHNHKVSKVEVIQLESPEPVYDITVDKYHNFALSAGVFVHNSDIKRLFISRWADEGGLIFAPDFSQLELRIISSISKEPVWIEAYKRGEDIHAATGSAIFHKDIKDVTKAERKVGKCVTGDTLIKTNKGDIPIKDIVGKIPDDQIIDYKGDLEVLTIDGYRPITKTYKLDDAEIVKVTTVSGEVLNCTPNHPFVIGFDSDNKPILKEARLLTDKDDIYIIEERN